MSTFISLFVCPSICLYTHVPSIIKLGYDTLLSGVLISLTKWLAGLTPASIQILGLAQLSPTDTFNLEVPKLK